MSILARPSSLFPKHEKDSSPIHGDQTHVLYLLLVRERDSSSEAAQLTVKSYRGEDYQGYASEEHENCIC